VTAAQRELRHIGLEVGDAILGWALIFLLLFAVIGLIVTWPPGWKLIAVVAVLAIVAPVVLIVSILDLLGIAQAALADPNWVGMNKEAYAFAGLLYWLGCFSLSRVGLALERSRSKGERH